MDDIMNASFGEVSNKIKGTFKKTINIRQYESEVLEIESELDIGDKELVGAERMLISALLQAQLEYTVYCNLAFKGLVTNTELQTRREELVEAVNTIKDKAESILGKDMSEYIRGIQLDEK